MERVSDEQLNVMIEFAAIDVAEAPGPMNHCRFLALTELRERREAEKAPCPEHAKRVAERTKKCTCARCGGFDDEAYYKE